MDPVGALVMAQAPSLDGWVAVLDDVDGRLAAAALDAGGRVRAFCDDIREQRRLPAATQASSRDEAVSGAHTVLWRLPRAVAAVEEDAERIASLADPGVVVVGGGRNHQLSKAMNTALGHHFERVWASRGVGKCRALLAEGPLRGSRTWPRRNRLDDVGLEVVAHGLTFNTNRLDHGTRLLIEALGERQLVGAPTPDRGTAVDLGCGSGILATLLARAGWHTHAVDVSAAACASTAATASANRVEVHVVQDDSLDGLGALDLIVTNPPFHRGAAKDTTPTRALFGEAANSLSDDGELWVVFNSHLPYLWWLTRDVGPTRIVRRDRDYTVTRTVRRADQHLSRS